MHYGFHTKSLQQLWNELLILPHLVGSLGPMLDDPLRHCSDGGSSSSRLRLQLSTLPPLPPCELYSLRGLVKDIDAFIHSPPWSVPFRSDHLSPYRNQIATMITLTHQHSREILTRPIPRPPSSSNKEDGRWYPPRGWYVLRARPRPRSISPPRLLPLVDSPIPGELRTGQIRGWKGY